MFRHNVYTGHSYDDSVLYVANKRKRLLIHFAHFLYLPVVWSLLIKVNAY